MSKTSPDILWIPSADRIVGAELTCFQKWLESEKGVRFAGY